MGMGVWHNVTLRWHLIGIVSFLFYKDVAPTELDC